VLEEGAKGWGTRGRGMRDEGSGMRAPGSCLVLVLVLEEKWQSGRVAEWQ